MRTKTWSGKHEVYLPFVKLKRRYVDNIQKDLKRNPIGVCARGSFDLGEGHAAQI